MSLVRAGRNLKPDGADYLNSRLSAGGLAFWLEMVTGSIMPFPDVERDLAVSSSSSGSLFRKLHSLFNVRRLKGSAIDAMTTSLRKLETILQKPGDDYPEGYEGLWVEFFDHSRILQRLLHRSERKLVRRVEHYYNAFYILHLPLQNFAPESEPGRAVCHI